MELFHSHQQWQGLLTKGLMLQCLCVQDTAPRLDLSPHDFVSSDPSRKYSGSRIQGGLGFEGYRGTVVPPVIHRVVRGEDPSARMSIQCPRIQFLTSSIPSPRTFPDQVSFQKASFYTKQNTVESRFATVRFLTIHFYDPRQAGPSTPDLRCITVATQASFLYLVRF